MKPDAVLIAGPTASGKSQVALELARRNNGVVINADSMQVYREVRVLSARPSDADMAAVPHALYGHVSVTESYSVGRYQTDAFKALTEARRARRLPIFVGGTGLYFAALTKGLADIPAVPPSIRTAARTRLAAVGVAALHAELAALDPETASRLRPSDPQRVLRAYEVWKATGRPLAEWQRLGGNPVLEGLRIQPYILDLPRPLLRDRIAVRFHAMVAAGARAEARALVGLEPSLPAAKILGLRQLAGDLPDAEAVGLAVTATHQFAKRQITWFRNRMADWTWLEASDLSNIIARIDQKIS